MKKYLVEMVKYAEDSREIVNSWVELETTDRAEAIAKAQTLTDPGYGGLVSIEDEHGALEVEYEITHEELVLSSQYETLYESEDGTFYGTNHEPFPSDDGSEILVKAYDIRNDAYMLTFEPNPNCKPGEDAPEDWSDWNPIHIEWLALE